MDDSAANWIQRFTTENGRPPRILHLGNICNNAYQTAKMLNAAGADCDVLCADYYYIMATPEWDETIIEGDLGNLYYPLLHRAAIQGFERPRWFAQAPTPLAIAYLIAKRQGKTAKAGRLWRKMEEQRARIAEEENGLGKAPASLLSILNGLWGKALYYLDYLAHVLIELFTQPGRFLGRVRQKLGLLSTEKQAILADIDTVAGAARQEKQFEACVDMEVLRRAEEDARTLFPERDLSLSRNVTHFFVYLAQYKALFSYYDFVQAYENQIVWPYLAGAKNYAAYEHGALRNFVYGETDWAHLALLGYAHAGAIYVTNLDNCESARYIAEKTDAKIVYGLHGIDVARIVYKMENDIPRRGFNPRFGVPKDVPLFYSPSRHTFLPKEGVFLKGEEKLIGAAARLAKEGYTFRLSLSSWGDGIDQVKELVARHPALEKIVLWNPPQVKEEFYAVLQNVDAIVDQFYLNGYGGIFFETLCARAPLISCSPGPHPVERFFAQPPPYLPADSEDDIYSAMKRVLENPGEVHALAQTGRAWMLANHSAHNIVEKCCEAFAYLLPVGG